ncbi:MAG: hypothetical protein QOH83_288 [Solirubrobacteraceae bacterium]|jgi:hypothetical protein|nr:hypothetical protein [Solirubrobacteraceae bacterium]
MEQSTAERRLVKSPPELWAEVSCEDTLGRRLAQFGEIRITRLEPETTVAWEGERASGTVELAPAGWGTKVVLTALPARRPPAPEPTTAPVPAVRPPEPAPMPTASAVRPPEPEPARAGERTPEPAPVALEPAPAPVAAAPRPEPAAVQPPEPRPEEPATPPAPQERKSGFFARLFRRPPAELAPVAYRFPPQPNPVQAPVAVAAATSPTPPPAAPEPSPPALGPEPTPPEPDPAPTLRTPAVPPADAGLDTERTVAILTEVLDDLGAAHHRPYSRDELS